MARMNGVAIIPRVIQPDGPTRFHAICGNAIYDKRLFDDMWCSRDGLFRSLFIANLIHKAPMVTNFIPKNGFVVCTA